VETKEYVEYLLKNYHQIKREIDQLVLILESPIYDSEEETIEALTFSTPQGERVSTSTISDKTSKIALIYREVNEKQKTAGRKDVEKIIKVNQFELIKLENSIAALDESLREVINGIYIQKMKRSDICRSLYISENTLNRYRKKGIDEIAMIFRTCRLAI
jgi:DNA-directed RNA polymerase specialized sigma subunit